ncbi:DUF1735 domain-containing protein [Niabella sp. CC-SYL272]|uniref:DUF1735 domain-containing protein n=1 Tax=Niabella agricola TaxID=2891571 RepID=UPI001F27CE1C|nr:DUF1735 domain-containing protein [Niabella agricola]MCF3111301.1 DUF1735 domain-containing protein [Niabella agricola]
MMQRFSNTTSLAFFMITLFLCACQEKRLDGMVEDRIYLVTPGLHTMPVYNWGKDSIGLQVIKSGTGQQPATVRLTIDPTLTDKYKENSEAQYELLDERFYKIASSVLEFKAEDYKKSFDFIIDVTALKQAGGAAKKYVLPCKVSISGGTVQAAKDAVLEEVLVIDLKEPYIAFESAGVMQNPISITAESANEFWFYTKVQANYPGAGNVAFELIADEEYVREYNRTNGTNLVPMPAAAVLFNTGQWTIPPHGSIRQLDCRILKDKLVNSNGLPAYGEYWMPLLIKSVSTNGIDPKKNIQIFRVLYTGGK